MTLNKFFFRLWLLHPPGVASQALYFQPCLFIIIDIQLWTVMHFVGISQFHFIAFCRVGLNWNWAETRESKGGALSEVDGDVQFH